MSHVANFLLGLLVAGTVIILLGTLFVVLISCIQKIIENIRYGKLEGKIISVNTPSLNTDPRMMQYFADVEIEKEVKGKRLTRIVVVQIEKASQYNVGEEFK